MAVDDSKEGSSKRKEVVVAYPDDEDELDRIAREMSLQPDDDDPQVIESKSSAPARARSKQDSEGKIEKLGSEALGPRRVSVPLPGIEVQAILNGGTSWKFDLGLPRNDMPHWLRT